MRFWLPILVFILVSPAWGQSKRAFNLIEKEKYDQAQEALLKNIEKDSLASEARYALSVLYFNDENPNFDAGIAYQYILESIADYQGTEIKEREKMAKSDIDSSTLINQKILIENYAFVQSKKGDTEEDYIAFLEKHPTSLKVDSAVWFRDLRAYEKATKKHTWQGYKAYMEKYPQSAQFAKAEDRYERLLYEDKTQDGKLASYLDFLEQYPSTWHRDAAETNIFRISTGDHALASYQAFIQQFPESAMADKAASRIWMIDPSVATSQYGQYLNGKQVQALEDLNAQNLFIQYLDGYVFQSSSYRIPGAYEWIAPEYKCEEITSPLLLVKNDSTMIINRQGDPIFIYPDIERIQLLGNGIAAYETVDGWGSILVSGEPIFGPAFDEIKLLQGQYLAVRDANLWGMWSVNGLEMIPPSFETLEEVANLIKAGTPERFDLVPPTFFIPYLDGQINALTGRYTDLELLDKELLLLYDDEKMGLFSLDMQPLVPMEDQEVIELPIGYLVEKDSSYFVKSREPFISSSTKWTDADFTKHWLMLKSDSTWSLYATAMDTLYASGLDSLHLIHENTVGGFKGDSVTYFFSTGKSFTVSNNCEFSLLLAPPVPNQDRTFYFQIEEDDKLWLLNNLADTISLPRNSDDLSALGSEYLLYTRRKKKGLLDSTGVTLLEPKYDGIANYKDGAVTLLNNGVLGLYHERKGVFIEPEYHRSPVFYSDTILIVFKEDKFALVSKDNAEILPNIYSNIEYFNDSVAWVSQGEHWSLLNIFNGNLILDSVTKHWKTDKESTEHHFETTRGRGVADAKSGLMINGNFNEIVKRGTHFDPIYITELFVNEASLYIQVVYNATGDILFKQAYTEEEYEKVICEN